MKKLVVIAEAEEMKLVKELGYDKYPVLVTGVGALNVIDALKDLPKDMTIFNIGYAGSKDLEPGKYYAVDKSFLYHPNVNYPENETYLGIHYSTAYENGELFNADERIVSCYTSNDFVLETDKKGCVFDMELAFIAALGFENLVSFKYVSDNLDLQEYRHNFNEK